jgi:hypothetical protein
MRTETTTAAVLIGAVDGTTILLLFFVLLRSLWHCRSSSLLIERMHSKPLVGCGVGGGEAKANDKYGRGCGLGLFRWLLLHRIFCPMFECTFHAQKSFYRGK